MFFFKNKNAKFWNVIMQIFFKNQSFHWTHSIGLFDLKWHQKDQHFLIFVKCLNQKTSLHQILIKHYLTHIKKWLIRHQEQASKQFYTRFNLIIAFNWIKSNNTFLNWWHLHIVPSVWGRTSVWEWEHLTFLKLKFYKLNLK